MARTIAHHQRVVRCFATVMLTHWPALGSLSQKERLSAFERLVHATKANPSVRYTVVARIVGQMPSYLRRAAINAAFGVVASFMSNYSNWLGKTPVELPPKTSKKRKAAVKALRESERELGGRPPRMGFSTVNPSLYGGNMIREGKHLATVQIKLLGADGQWRFSEPLKVNGKLKRLPKRLDLSPSLVLKGAKAMLVCPAAVAWRKWVPKAEAARVCAIDVGINTAATAVIVDSAGTVIARTFLTCGRHDGQRDALQSRIAEKQAASGQAGRGFCKRLYRRIAGLSLDAARQLSSQLAAFAQKHGAEAFVVEDLKGWKPKGKGKKQRQRFHRFQHRALVNAVALRAEELGMRMVEVFARGTSRWAYDGSGKVSRSKDNAQLATFASGKQYNADLNGANNIAARGLAWLLGIENPRSAKDPGEGTRMPFVLADIWAHARTLRGHLTASGVSTDAPSKSPAAIY